MLVAWLALVFQDHTNQSCNSLTRCVLVHVSILMQMILARNLDFMPLFKAKLKNKYALRQPWAMRRSGCHWRLRFATGCANHRGTQITHRAPLNQESVGQRAGRSWLSLRISARNDNKDKRMAHANTTMHFIVRICADACGNAPNYGHGNACASTQASKPWMNH